MDLKQYFSSFRNGIIGIDKSFFTPYGHKKITYLDWTASGRFYRPIEEKLTNVFGPFIGNTHTESNVTGGTMTRCYNEARNIIKRHVNASESDVVLTDGTGMTGAVNKLQRILGLKIHENFCEKFVLFEQDKPVVFITSMEHHSNHTSWLETICDVEVIPNCEKDVVDLEFLKTRLECYHGKRKLIGSFTACSNVTGVITPYHKLAKLMHEYGGICIIDFSASAPYVKINMHPSDPLEKIDAVLFSPHKFLGGPGSSGILVFDSAFYQNNIPDHPGGGTVEWTNPWGEKEYIRDIATREDGGTPGFLQAIRAALCIQLKEKMGVDRIKARELELISFAASELRKINNVVLLDDSKHDKIGIFSFYVKDVHHNLVVRLLNDVYGIQVRGGCSCAGTYGHMLLGISKKQSNAITCEISKGNKSVKPGWIRMSIHPTTTEEEIRFFSESLSEIVANVEGWSKKYTYLPEQNDFVHMNHRNKNVSAYFQL